MSDDEEVIKFEITDYDLNNEFNTRRARRGTKEQQIYGVWAANDSDAEDEVENLRRGREKKPKDYTAPIGFIAGGIHQAGQKKSEKDVAIKEEPSFKVSVDSSDEEPLSQIPGESETAGLRRRGFGLVNKQPKLGGSVGNWEKHTKGIGAKLLLQMGYQPGKGLGKALQGISAPVEATVRKGRGAIGAYGPEKSTMKIKKKEEALRAITDKEDVPKKTGNWKKSHKGRYFYKDATDVIQEGKITSTHTESSAALARVPVIDMTGRGKVVLSGYHALRSARAPGDIEDGTPTTRYEDLPRKDCRNFAIPELIHNLDLLVDCCEQDIISASRAGHTAEDEEVALQKELEDLAVDLKQQDCNIDTLELLLEKLEDVNKPDLTFEEVYQHFADLKENQSAEYEAFVLGTVFESAIGPTIAPMMSAWKPLQSPSEPIAYFLKCRELMSADTYHSLLWQQFVTNIRRAAQEWNPRQPQSFLNIVSSWSDVAPSWLVRHAVASSAVPRLAAAAKDWDPTLDPQPLHEWVLPWHPIAGDELAASVYPVLREKLSAALAGWHPADGSARALLEPWKQAWGESLIALFNHHILPKLDACLLAEPIDLTGGKSAAWNWCKEWANVGGWTALAAAVTRSLLSRWLASLAAWLNTSPPHANVLACYTAWKALFPEEVLQKPAIRDIFRKALDMMNRSADVEMVAPPPPPAVHMMPVDSRSIAEVMASSNQQKTFMELLESKCVRNGISFLPMAGRLREGRPLYRIGTRMQCYIIRNVIMYSNNMGMSFQPISMDSLLHMAATQ